MTNPHVGSTNDLMTVAGKLAPGSEHEARMLKGAQAEAALAVAFEQARTADALEAANLIAYLNAAATYRLAYPVPENVLKSVQAQVETRLGLA